MYALWDEVGAVKGARFVLGDYFTQAEDAAGNRLVLYTDPERLKRHMLEIAPEDEKEITRITGDITALATRDMPVDFSIMGFLKMLPFVRMFYRYRMPASELAKRFKNPVLRELFDAAASWHDMSVGFGLWSLSCRPGGDGGYPLGGSKPFADAIAERYRSLGGKFTAGAAWKGSSSRRARRGHGARRRH